MTYKKISNNKYKKVLLQLNEEYSLEDEQRINEEDKIMNIYIGKNRYFKTHIVHFLATDENNKQFIGVFNTDLETYEKTCQFFGIYFLRVLQTLNIETIETLYGKV